LRYLLAPVMLTVLLLAVANAQPQPRGFMFFDDFTDASNFSAFWSTVSGTWTAQGGFLKNAGMDEEILVTNQEFGDFYLEANLTLISGQGFGLLFRYQGPSAYYMFRPHYGDQAQLWLKTPLGGWTLLASKPSPLPTPGEYHRYSVIANGTRLMAMRDGTVLLNVTDGSLPSGRIGFRAVDTRIQCNRAMVLFSAPAPATVTLTSTTTKPTTVTSTQTLTSFFTTNGTVIQYKTLTSYVATMTVLGTSTSYISTVNTTVTRPYTVYSIVPTTITSTSFSPTITVGTTQTQIVWAYSTTTYVVGIYSATSTSWATETWTTTLWSALSTTSLTTTYFATEWTTITSTHSAILTTYQWAFQTFTSTLTKVIEAPGIGPLRIEYAYAMLGLIGGAGAVYFALVRGRPAPEEKPAEPRQRPRRRQGPSPGESLRELLERFRRQEEE